MKTSNQNYEFKNSLENLSTLLSIELSEIIDLNNSLTKEEKLSIVADLNFLVQKINFIEQKHQILDKKRIS